jgi:flagellar assembly factor FliW
MQLTRESLPTQPGLDTLEIELPAGLIGLPHLRRFEIAALPESWPFVSLRSLGAEEIHFLAVSPQNLLPDYQLELGDDDTEALDLAGADDALIYNIVTVHNSERQYVTANLIGPIVINRRTRLGRQVILANSDEFSAKHPLIDERQTAACA